MECWLRRLGRSRSFSIRYSRMLKKPASFVLASFRSSTYPRGYASGPSLAAALLDELFEHPAGVATLVPYVPVLEALLRETGIPQPHGPRVARAQRREDDDDDLYPRAQPWRPCWLAFLVVRRKPCGFSSLRGHLPFVGTGISRQFCWLAEMIWPSNYS